MTIHLHQGDLPAGLSFGDSVAIDTETMGLNPLRDRLCLAQLSSGDGDAHLVQFAPGKYNAPNLRALLLDQKVLKLFHFGRFDIAVMAHYLGVVASPVYCTKIASKLVRTFTDRHGLKDLCRDLIGVDLSGAKLAFVDLSHANLTDANLNGATLFFVNVSGATWSNTICPDGTNSHADGGTCVGHF